MGSLYRKTKRLLDSTGQPIIDEETGKPKQVEVGPLWIKFYRNGRPFRESTGTLDMAEAKRKLKEREGDIAKGHFTGLAGDRLKYDDLAADLRRHYETTGSRDLKEADVRFKPLAAFFGGYKARVIEPDLVTRYVQKRQAAEVSNGTINRELAVLIKMLRLAYEQNKLARIPKIQKLKEAPPRAGFFEPSDFETVRSHLRPDHQVAVTIAYTYGWRMQSEVLTLPLAQVDVEAGTLRLAPGTTKNGDGRVVYLTPELQGLLVGQIERVKALGKRLGRIIPYLFPHLETRLAGQRMKDFRYTWATACKNAGLLGMIRHDFRRSAVRNLSNAQVPQTVAMRITGHKTDAVYRRYCIVSPGDLQEATRKLSAPVLGTISGTPQPSRLAAH
jgi:integrase